MMEGCELKIGSPDANGDGEVRRRGKWERGGGGGGRTVLIVVPGPASPCPDQDMTPPLIDLIKVDK